MSFRHLQTRWTMSIVNCCYIKTKFFVRQACIKRPWITLAATRNKFVTNWLWKRWEVCWFFYSFTLIYFELVKLDTSCSPLTSYLRVCRECLPATSWIELEKWLKHGLKCLSYNKEGTCIEFWSIHFVHFVCSGSSLSRDVQTSRSPETFSSASRVDPEAFPGQMSDIVTRVSWVFPSVSSQQHMTETPPKGGVH